MTLKRPRLSAGTDAAPAAASARYRVPSSSDPRISSAAAATAVSSASAVTTQAWNEADELVHGGGLPVEGGVDPMIG